MCSERQSAPSSPAFCSLLSIMLELFAMGSLLERAMGGGVPHGQLIGAFVGHLVTMSAIVVISVLKPWGQRPQRTATTH